MHSQIAPRSATRLDASTRTPHCLTKRQSARTVRSGAASITEVSVFLEEIAVQRTPKLLSSLVRVLEAQGGKAVGPVDRAGLHPLVVPVCSQGDSGQDVITCLLRWPQPSKYPNMTMPVVRMKRGARNVQLLARSVDEYLHRLLAEEDIQASEAGVAQRPLAQAAGPEAAALYKAGDAAAAGSTGPRASLYIVRTAGKFPDLCEQLALGHLSRGDKTSALVASEWYMRNQFFPGWARPYELASELFTELKRDEEARDMARVALRLPWWSLSKPVAEVAKVAQLEGRDFEQVKHVLSEEAVAAANATTMGRPAAPKEVKSQQQLALERAETILDLVAAGSLPDYNVVRGDLADAYRAAGLTDVANFITAAS